MDLKYTIRTYCPDDAEGLMSMWENSQAEWPGGIPIGINETADEFDREKTRGAELVHFIAQEDVTGKIVGYCGLSEATKRSTHAEIPLINVIPSKHGYGIGKALLLRAISETVSRGYIRLQLGTWPGNMKAIGLYKRCGFFWVPESDVFMVNYIPQILNNSMVRRILESENWYRLLKSKCEIRPDDFKLGKMNAYKYKFYSKDGDLIEIIIDRISDYISGIDCGDFSVQIRTDNSSGWKGFPRHVVWEYWNKTSQSISVQIQFTGQSGVEYSSKHDALIEPNGRESGMFPVEIPLTIQHDDFKESPNISAVIRTNHEEFVMGCGFKPVNPIDIELKPEKRILPPGKIVKRTLTIKNNMTFPVQTNFTLSTLNGLSVRMNRKKYKIQPESQIGAEIELKCETDSNQFLIHGNCKGKFSRQLPDISMAVASRKIGECVYLNDDDSIHYVNDFFSATFFKRNGKVRISSGTNSTKGLALSMPVIGPPFRFWSEQRKCDIVCNSLHGVYEVCMTSDSVEKPGLHLKGKVILDRSPFVRIKWSVVNTRVEDVTIDARLDSFPIGHRSARYIPMNGKILTSDDPRWPFGKKDVPSDPSCFDEKWIAMQFSDDFVIGYFWQDNPDDINMEHFNFANLLFRERTIPGENEWELPLQTYFIGYGHVQNIACIANPTANQNGRKKQFGDILSINFKEKPIFLCTHKTVSAHLVNQRKYPETGLLKIESSSKIKLKENTFEIDNLNSQNSIALTLDMSTDMKEMNATALKARFQNANQVRRYEIPVIITPPTTSIAREKSKIGKFSIYRVKNGPLEFAVSPGFGGSLIDLKYGNDTLINSAFPKTGNFGFESPWYGGVNCLLGLKSWHIKFDRIRRSRWVEKHDATGRKWEGVSVSWKFSDEPAMRGVRFVTDYLTSIDRPFLNVINRVHNTSEFERDLFCTCMIFPMIRAGGFRQKAIYREMVNSRLCERRWSEIGSVIECKNGISWHGDSTGANLYVMPGKIPQIGSNAIVDTGKQGMYMFTIFALSISPGSTVTCPLYLIGFRGDPYSAFNFDALSDLMVSY